MRSPAELQRVGVWHGRVYLGRGPGRGAWLCPSEACLVRALRRGALVRALRLEGVEARAALEVLREAWPRVIAERGAKIV